MDSDRPNKLRSLGMKSLQQSIHIPRRPSLGDTQQSAPLHSKPNQTILHDSTHAPSRIDDARRLHRASNRSEHTPAAVRSKQRPTSDAKRSGTNDEKVEIPNHTGPQFGHLVFKVLVVGNSEVGKSTFIRNALEVKDPGPSAVASSRVSLHGIVYRVQMFELDLEEIDIQDDNKILWPKYVNGASFSSPDSVICLFDSGEKDSLNGIPYFLSALTKHDIPVQLVASEAAVQNETYDVELFINKVQQHFPEVLHATFRESHTSDPQKCMLTALKAILGQSPSDTADVTPTAPASLRRKKSTVSLGKYDAASVSIPPDDDVNNVADHGVSVESNSAHEQPKNLGSTHARSPAQSVVRGSEQRSPISETGSFTSAPSSPAQQSFSPKSERFESKPEMLMRRRGTTDTVDSLIHHTFFHVEDDSSQEQDGEDRAEKEDPLTEDVSSSFQVTSFPLLVDRLLRLPATKHESKFVPAFLCLYRAFATPSTLLAEFIDRFTLIENGNEVQFNKVAELLRHLQILANWTATYPGDFADPDVHETATKFVQGIEKHKNLAPAAKEISNNLQIFVEDEDIDWAYDESRGAGGVAQEQCIGSDKLRRTTSLPNEDEDSSEDSPSDDETKDARSSVRNSLTASTASSLPKQSMMSSQSAVNLATLENAREQAKRLRSIPHISLGKIQWHLFMDTPTDELARELTRIDWTRYSAIRPRDFVREVLLPRRKTGRSNISLMIKHFNHLSYFVAAIILIRDKPKHRAKAAVKVMDLAWKVRQLNNYNSVNAIVAGMQNTAVTRLTQTMDLVPTETQRQFMRLNVLVDATKSYATYRMAWENSATERIPLIPSLQKDLKIAMLANPTFVGSNICWKKFEIMGDAIISVQKSQEMPYTFPEKTQRSQEITKLFLETKIIEDDEETGDPSKELYERSKQIESHIINNDSKKRFDWLWR